MKTLPMRKTDSVNNSVLGGKNSSKPNQTQKTNKNSHKTKQKISTIKTKTHKTPNFKDFQWLFFFHGTLVLKDTSLISIA